MRYSLPMASFFDGGGQDVPDKVVCINIVKWYVLIWLS